MRWAANRVILLGWVVGEPVVSYDQRGLRIAKAVLQTLNTVVNKSAGKNEVFPQDYPLVFEGPLAEILCSYGHDGAIVYVEGQLSSKRIRDEAGLECLLVEVLATNLKIIELMERQRIEYEKARNLQKTLDALPPLPPDDPMCTAGYTVSQTFPGGLPKTRKPRGPKGNKKR